MKVAIPVFGPRVSPRFDYAPGLLLFHLEDGKVVGSEKYSLQAWDRIRRLQRLRELGVQALICGGIDGNSAQVLSACGIRVIAWVAGDADEAMESFLRGRLRPGAQFRSRCRRRPRGGKSFGRG